ncbi:MAG: alpha-L-rhamnosidase N-terminal domain-containing protein [Trueperaceae bacterium]|nr:alpha-L-rhamnosidase N-terminal domain-containing protein [Trueperaceae bacterium]
MTELVGPKHFPEVRWHGHWVWVPEEPIQQGDPVGWSTPEQPESNGLFRKTFDLTRVPELVPARITADSRYVLFVNGQEVFRGPVRSQPRRMYYDLFDLAPYLHKGQNVLAVFVKYYGKAKSTWMPAVANGTLGKSGVMVFEANLGDTWLVSDASWLAQKTEAYLNDAYDADAPVVVAGVPAESFDARKFDPDWHSLEFDDSSWGQAQVITPFHIGGRGRSQPPSDPYGPLFPRPIAKLGGKRLGQASITVETVTVPVDTSRNGPAGRAEKSAAEHKASSSQTSSSLPVTFTPPQNGHARIIIDMGRIVAGLVELNLSAPAGTVFDIGYFETPATLPAHFGAQGGSRYIARGKNDQHIVFDPKGLRYAYILVHGSAERVTLTDFAINEYNYPWQGDASFECNDEALNRLHKAGIRTVELNSWDAFMDCPTREQRAWVGDAVVHQMVHLATNSDWRLAWHYLTLGNSPRSDGILPMSVAGDVEGGQGFTIPDWSIHWIHGVYNLYRFTGDLTKVKEFMPTIERILRWYLPYQTSNGLLQDVPEWNLIDWSSLFSNEQSALVNASWARGLRDYAEMAGWLGESASQAWAEEVYTRVKKGFERFWDEERGLYVDHLKDGVQQRPANQISSALAIVSELAPKERWQRIIETITDEKRLVVRSWMFQNGDEPEVKDAPPGFIQMATSRFAINWDAEKEIVIAEPFMSYVVHDAVAKAGKADILPQLYKRWLDFLVDGYDTIGENWGNGTHVHGWSSTPSKDLIFYTLGVSPEEPGYTVARITPRLGALNWAKATVPTPHGYITLEVSASSLKLSSPVPVLLDLAGKEVQRLEAGNYEF